MPGNSVDSEVNEIHTRVGIWTYDGYDRSLDVRLCKEEEGVEETERAVDHCSSAPQ